MRFFFFRFRDLRFRAHATDLCNVTTASLRPAEAPDLSVRTYAVGPLALHREYTRATRDDGTTYARPIRSGAWTLRHAATGATVGATFPRLRDGIAAATRVLRKRCGRNAYAALRPCPSAVARASKVMRRACVQHFGVGPAC